MELQVVKIGNSGGTRFSKELIRKYKIMDKVEIIERDDCIVLKPTAAPRENWDEAFREMHLNSDDRLFFDDIFADEIPVL